MVMVIDQKRIAEFSLDVYPLELIFLEHQRCEAMEEKAETHTKYLQEMIS